VKVGADSPRLFDAIATEAVPRLDEFDPQALANTLWSFAKSGVKVPRFFDAVAIAALPQISKFNSQDLSITVWAFATAGITAPTLFDAVAAAARARASQLEELDFANIAWAFATAGVAAPRLFEAIANESLTRLGEFSPQGVANMAWAFACDGCVSYDFTAAILDRGVEGMPSFTPYQLRRLYLFWLVARLEHPDLHPLESHHEETLRETFMRGAPRPPRNQADVSTALSQLGWTHEIEFVTDEGLTLDIAQPGAKQCVLLDGPSNYLRETGTGSYVRNGATQLKTRLLERLGWTVTCVPFYEWNRLGSDDDRRRYLEMQLSTAESASPATQFDSPE